MPAYCPGVASKSVFKRLTAPLPTDKRLSCARLDIGIPPTLALTKDPGWCSIPEQKIGRYSELIHHNKWLELCPDVTGEAELSARAALRKPIDNRLPQVPGSNTEISFHGFYSVNSGNRRQDR